MKPAPQDGPVAIIGGAGFIGSNLARSFLDDGADVLVVDNLSRAGVERNLRWLEASAPGRVRLLKTDIADGAALGPALAQARAVFDLAAQTAVTTSLADPMADFRTNALGTLNVLEAVRRSGRAIPVIYSSTNKVYGSLTDLAMRREGERYVPEDAAIAAHGIGEDRPLEFRTPYGCSKGVADQYVLDYAQSFGLPTAVLRMSCIYGPRQFGTEDQGWVAHFMIRALRGEAITLYGDGRQVRDILFVADAVAAYRTVLDNIEQVSGRAFNLGGGPGNAVSVRQVIDAIGDRIGRPLAVEAGPWRQGDQYYFVADTRRLADTLGWRARTGWEAGLDQLMDWLQSLDRLGERQREVA